MAQLRRELTALAGGNPIKHCALVVRCIKQPKSLVLPDILNSLFLSLDWNNLNNVDELVDEVRNRSLPLELWSLSSCGTS